MSQGNQVSCHNACSELFCGESEDFQQLVAAAVDWLCRNQYVRSEFLLDLTYRVTREVSHWVYFIVAKYHAGFWIAAC